MSGSELVRSLVIRFAILFAGLAAVLDAKQGFAQSAAATATVATETLAGTPRQQAWLAASVAERAKLAEQLGEEGARAFAGSKGWEAAFDGIGRGIMQGPDQVYIAKDGIVHVLEAKGGSGQLGVAYGHPQGSSEWAVESAKKVLASGKATEAERRAATRILEAASTGKLQVHVVRTSHVLGEPVAATLEQTVQCSDEAARLAKLAIGRPVLSGVAEGAAQAADDAGRASAAGRRTLQTASKAALPLAAVVDGSLRVYEATAIEERFATGEITQETREVEHVKNAAGMAGGWAGAWIGAQVGTAGGAAAGSVVPGPGTAIGGTVGAVAGGVAGYFGGEAAASFAAEWAVEQVHAAGTTIAGSSSAAFDRAASLWRRAWGE